MNDQERLARNEKIKRNGAATRARHKRMSCKTYELKVDLSHLSNHTKDRLRRLFLEAKWFYNHIVTNDLIFAKEPWKLTKVQVRNKDKQFESRNLNVLSGQMKQELVARAKNAISGLSVLKEHGHKVGALKPKKRVGSLQMIQYEKTFDLVGDRVKVQNIDQSLRVCGFGQIPTTMESEVATVRLIQTRDSNYFIHLTVYQKKERRKFKTKSGIGIDAGITNQMMLGDSWSGLGMQIRERVPVTKKLRRINRRFSKRKKGSESRRAMRRRLNAEYRHITNTRKDVRNKLTSTKSGIPSVFRTIATQKDHISGWQTMWGARVQTSAIGGMMAALRSRAHTPIIVDRWTPNTQPCPRCGALNPDLKGLENLSNRTPECRECGFRTDRDVWSAMNDSNQIPLAERKPVDMKAYTEMAEYFNSIPHVEARLMEIPTIETRGKETESRQAPSQGSHPTSVGGL